MKKAFIFLISAVLSAPAFPAETYRLTPEEAVEIALKNNLDLKTSEIALRTKQRNKRQVYNQLMPSLSAGVALSRSNLNPGENMRKMFSSGSSSGGASSMIPSTVYPDWTASFQVNGTFALNGAFFTAVGECPALFPALYALAALVYLAASKKIKDKDARKKAFTMFI